MSSENTLLTETPQPTPPPAPKSNIRSFIVGVLIVALLATWGYIIYDKSNERQLIEQKDNKNAALTGEKDSLQNLFNDATTRYDNLQTADTKKDSTITSKDKEIADKKAKIQSLLRKDNATKEELVQAKTLIASLNQDIDGYKTQIETLKNANTQLTVEKQQVTEERDIVQKSFDSAKDVVKQKENIIDVGSTLHASNFNILGIDAKKNGKEKQTTNAKKVNKLRISFDLDENLITQSGSKTLYIAITGPDGKTISVQELGSGTFTSRDSQEVAFTQKLDVNYTQAKRQTISFDWKQNTNFSIGAYKIEVYNNGFKIGEGVTHLTKGGLFG